MKIGYWLFLLICVFQQARAMKSPGRIHHKFRYVIQQDDYRKIEQAVENDDPTFLEKLFGKGCEWLEGSAFYHNKFGYNGRSILHDVAHKGSIKVLRSVLKRGYDVNYHYIPDNKQREYYLPLHYAIHCQKEEVRPQLIQFLVLHGAQLFEEHQSASFAAQDWLFQPTIGLKTFLQAPRVAPEAPQGTMWQETKEGLVALVCSLKRFKAMNNITVPKDMRQLLCQYALKVDGPLTERFLLSELCYLAQKKLVPHILQMLLDAHVVVLHEALKKTVLVKTVWDNNGPHHEEQPPYQAINKRVRVRDTETFKMARQLLDPDPEKIREQLGQGIKENYRQLLFGKET